MGIFRSTDPTTFDDVDGIIINESAPSPNISGIAANVAILVGQFERGDVSMQDVGSIGQFFELYGNNSAFKGNIALRNKKFGKLRVIRVVASAAAKGAKTFQTAGAVDTITFTAKWKGAYGNNIQVTVATGSSSGKKYTIHDNNANAVLPDEVYDNIAIASVTASTFSGSKLVDVTVLATAAEPANASATSLTAGSDGSVADTDYQTAIGKTEVEAAGNILFLDDYSATRNGYLKTTAANMQDKMVILAGAKTDSVSAAITDVAGYRDSDGRIIYAYPWLMTSIDGVNTAVNPASFYASLLSQTAPNIDPAYGKNTQYLAGITDLYLQPTRQDYINMKTAGISAFENDNDTGMKIKSGIVTQIVDSSKIMVFRRRMADYLTASAARFMKAYQNAPNTRGNRDAVKAALLSFIQRNEMAGLLPADSEVLSGKAKLVDTESLNTNDSIALGFFKVLWKQRIYSSMRYIVIQAEIGESVVVTDQG